MKNIKIIWIIILILVTSICFALFFSILFQYEQQNLQEKIEWALRETITKDYDKRFLVGTIHFAHPRGQKIKNCTLISEKEEKKYQFNDSIDEQTANRLIGQYLMIDSFPIIPDDINAIFKDELEKNGINNRAGIIYRLNGKPLYSENDSISPRTAYLTQAMMPDIENKISVQAWVNYSWKTILRQISRNTR